MSRKSNVLNGFDQAGSDGDNKCFLNGSIEIGGVDVTAKLNNFSELRWIEVTCTAALLDGAGKINVIEGDDDYQYKVRHIKLIGGGTNFGSGGNRTLGLLDGTTTYTTVPNASLETAPATTVDWGNAELPFLTGTADTKTVAGQDLYFAYNGGTTDHATGSIKFSVCVEIFPI
jgi:hypothetical protein